MRAATSSNIIKRAPAPVRIETRGARTKCPTIAPSPVTPTTSSTSSVAMKVASTPSVSSRQELPSLQPVPLKTESSPSAGLKVPARDVSKSASISPHKKLVLGMHVEAATDRILTFLQNARAQNIPVRAGKWNPEEDAYLRKLVELFCLGVLDEVVPKSSMRAWLSRMLNCCPMRISKKQMNGEKFVGKAKFKRSDDAIRQMTQMQYDATCDEIYQLRADFIIHWAKDEFAKRTTKDVAMTFDEWYAKALEIIPRPKIAAHDHIVETKRRPEPESIDALYAQMQQDRVKQRQRTATTATAVAAHNRCYKRQRVSAAAVNIHTKTETQFQDLMASLALPCEPVALPESSLSATYIDSLDAAESWMLEICTEPEFEMLESCNNTSSFGQHLGLDKTGTTTEPEDKFQCNEVLSPQDAGALQFDFGLPSKLENHDVSHDVLDLPSCDADVWDDNDLLLDSFTLLSDQSLVLWDDSDSLALDASSSSSHHHAARAPCISTLQL